jgi:hypothetical protein
MLDKEIFILAELLDKNDPGVKLSLPDGPYRQDLPTNRPWRGSENQRLISLSGRYRERVSEWNAPIGQQFELRLSDRGEVMILGIPSADLAGLKPAIQLRAKSKPYQIRE